VEVGSILEYRLRIAYLHGTPPPRWELQSHYFTHAEHFLFKPSGATGTLYGRHGKILDNLVAVTTPQDIPVTVQTKKNVSTIDLTDVPPVPDEDWMPPINTIRWREEFYYTYTLSLVEFWNTEMKFWAQDTDEFAKVTGTIKKAAESLVSAGDSDEQKARKIYAAVEKLENTDFTRVRTEAERKRAKLKEISRAEDVWKNQSGAGNSIALLYVALARAAGLKVWVMQVVDRSNAVFDRTYLDADQLEDYIAIVNLGGKEVYVDPSQKVCPFGVLHWAHTLSGGFRESETGPVIAWTPAPLYKDNAVQRTADLTLDAEGNIKGTARLVLSGAEAVYWRQLALDNDENELKKEFEETLNGDLSEGITATFDRFQGLDNNEMNLTAIVNLSGTLGAPAGKRLILPGLFFESRAKHPFVAQDKRITPIDVHYPKMESDDVVYHLPPGYAAESTPKTSDVNWPGSAALRISSGTKDDVLEVTRIFARNFTLLKPKGYEDLHDFYLKLAAADQQQIVLSRAAPSKGN
jgi:transglutaminase-like putative cysteine protease